MFEYRILTDPLFLHQVKIPMLILAIACGVMILAAAVLAAAALRRAKKRDAQEEPFFTDDPPCS